ncbi:hypothetical protein ACFFX0_32735 [Citricoccus parietis]|uniref:Uncharacterized protein n=1 Tax=Citricoccus parietis TaxID=592307 RepID=A0ABV5G9R1_9MICC
MPVFPLNNFSTDAGSKDPTCTEDQSRFALLCIEASRVSADSLPAPSKRRRTLGHPRVASSFDGEYQTDSCASPRATLYPRIWVVDPLANDGATRTFNSPNRSMYWDGVAAVASAVRIRRRSSGRGAWG